MSQEKMSFDVVQLLGKISEDMQSLTESVRMLCRIAAENLLEETKVSEEKKEEPVISLEKVRGVLASKSQAGYTAEVRAIVTKFGAKRLSDIDPKDYPAVLKEAEAIGHE